MTLHRTIGVPYIPGSALRGLARAYAAYSAEPTEIFGSTERVGQVEFLDALPNADCRMKLSVLTPHFPDWYINGESPGEWMSPVPVSFLVIGTGSFTIDILGENESCRLAARYLQAGLDELGIGSKTSSGYGWLLAEAQA